MKKGCQMSRQAKIEYGKVIYWRYRRASKREKHKILDEFCRTCDYNRKYAIRKLKGPAPSGKSNLRSTRRAQVKVRLENLEDGFLGGVISKDRYRQLKAEWEAELESLPEPTTQAQPIMTYDDALERLRAITQLLKEHMLVNPELVNRIFRAMMSAVWVDIETGQVAAYTLKSWCAAQFPPDKVRAIQEDELGKRLPGDQFFGDLGSEHK